MSEWIIVEFVPSEKKFTKSLVKDVVSGIYGKEKLPNNFTTIVEQLFNGGKGKSLDIKIPKSNYVINLNLYPAQHFSKMPLDTSEGMRTVARLLIERGNADPSDSANYYFKNYLEKCIDVFNILEPSYGRGDREESIYGTYMNIRVNDSVSKKTIYWMNFYGPKMVKSIGLQKLRKSPHSRLIELSNGGVLLMQGDNYYDADSIKRSELSKYLFNLTDIIEKIDRGN